MAASDLQMRVENQEKMIATLVERVGMQDQLIATLVQRVGTLESNEKILRSCLQHLIPLFRPLSTHEESFSNNLQSQLSGYFGGYHVLSSGVISAEESKLVLAVEVIMNGLSAVPVAGPAFSIVAPLVTNAVAEYTQESNTRYFYLFPSFSEIDRATFQVSRQIYHVYKNQIDLLSSEQAAMLGGAVGRELKGFMEYQKFYKRKILSVQSLLRAVGNFHLIKKPLIGFSNHRYSQPNNIDAKGYAEPWTYGQIFLGSGIKLEVEGIPARFYETSTTGTFVKPGPLQLLFGTERVYTKFPDCSAKVGHRVFKFDNARDAESYMLNNFPHFISEKKEGNQQMPSSTTINQPSNVLNKDQRRMVSIKIGPKDLYSTELFLDNQNFSDS